VWSDSVTVTLMEALYDGVVPVIARRTRAQSWLDGVKLERRSLFSSSWRRSSSLPGFSMTDRPTRSR